MVYDVLIENARVLDGRGNPWFRGSVAVQGGRIVAIGRFVEGEAVERLDAGGLYVCPGFIDTHTHSDLNYLVDSTAQSKVRQGVTTEVLGNCGSSAAPRVGVAASSGRIMGLEPTWTTYPQYLDVLDAAAKPVNLASLVGHGTIRTATVGLEDRPASPEEMAEMERILAEALEAGAFGMSMGLYFSPGMYAPRQELMRLSRIVARYGGLTATHNRDSSTRTIGVVEAVREMVEIGEAADCPTHIAHIKCHGPTVWGKSSEMLQLMDEARARGIEMTCDQYPYEASGGGVIPDTLPHSFQAGKSSEEIARLLAQPTVRAELYNAVAENVARRGGPARLIISTHPSEDVMGKSLEQLMAERGTNAAETVMDLLVEAGGDRVGWTCFSFSDEDVERFMQWPATMFGSDGSALSTEGPLSGGHPHPRNFGTFPRVLGRYVRDKGVLRLEEAVRKMTSLPAQTYGIAGRGTLAHGYWADLVLFDLARISDATYEQPKTYPQGIPYVMVNGEWVIKDGRFTGALPGRLLRR
ncbi:MAG: D-aminoacylase [Chloroflexi bacterium]|nr:D-aminoacylase [Chloroflexota bacterium]